jgi:hypothetical protein
MHLAVLAAPGVLTPWLGDPSQPTSLGDNQDKNKPLRKKLWCEGHVTPTQTPTQMPTQHFVCSSVCISLHTQSLTCYLMQGPDKPYPR